MNRPPYWTRPWTSDGEANRLRALAADAHRAEARAAWTSLIPDLPWLAEATFPRAEIWRSLVDLEVQPTSAGHAWYWGGGVASDGDREVIPTGTAFGAPTVLRHGPPAGAYVCAPIPDDDSDYEPWWRFTLQEPVGALVAGAVIELRPCHGVVFVPDGHPTLRDPDFIARMTLVLEPKR